MLLTLVLVASLSAQSLDDGTLLARRTLGAGVSYMHEDWSQYWEGTLRRSNGNVGSVSTQTVTLLSAYGVSDRLTLLAMLPYIWTDASQGPLHSMHGIQDLTLGAKYRLLSTPFTNQGTLRAIVVAAAGMPATDYTPDFLPLAIGLGSKRAGGRLTLNFQAHQGWFLNSSAGYTWRGKVRLERPSYYTNGQLYLTNEVKMPNVADYVFTAGYQSPEYPLVLILGVVAARGAIAALRQLRASSS